MHTYRIVGSKPAVGTSVQAAKFAGAVADLDQRTSVAALKVRPLTGVPLANVTVLAPLYSNVAGNGSRMKTVLLSTPKLPELDTLIE